jgi:hypothetical protein
LWRVTGILAPGGQLPAPNPYEAELGDYQPDRSSAKGFGRRHLAEDPFWPLPSNVLPATATKDQNLWTAGPDFESKELNGKSSDGKGKGKSK